MQKDNHAFVQNRLAEIILQRNGLQSVLAVKDAEAKTQKIEADAKQLTEWMKECVSALICVHMKTSVYQELFWLSAICTTVLNLPHIISQAD
jgi:hypothetical protein